MKLKVREHFITEPLFYRTLLSLSLPIVLQNLISNRLSIADNVMVGSLGEVAISGVTQANQITFVLSLFVLGLSSGASVLIAQYWGKRDTESVGHVFGISIHWKCVGIYDSRSPCPGTSHGNLHKRGGLD